jgi:hypothetical protein
MSDFGKMGLSAQEIFDLAYVGVMKQGRSSVAELVPGVGPTCAYMSEDGEARCAAGHVLAKVLEGETELFDQSDVAIHSLLCELGLYSHAYDAPVDIPEIQLMTAMQKAHDNAHGEWIRGGDFCEEYSSRMQNIAELFEVEVPQLD